MTRLKYIQYQPFQRSGEQQTVQFLAQICVQFNSSDLICRQSDDATILALSCYYQMLFEKSPTVFDNNDRFLIKSSHRLAVVDNQEQIIDVLMDGARDFKLELGQVDAYLRRSPTATVSCRVRIFALTPRFRQLARLNRGCHNLRMWLLVMGIESRSNPRVGDSRLLNSGRPDL